MANVPLQSLLEQANRALETGAADQAIGIAQHILQYVPELIEGHRLLGEAYLNANQPQQALGAFEHVLLADPENIAAYYGLGLAHQALEQRVEAIRSFERALEIQPNLVELRTQLTRLYAETPGSPGQFRLSRPGLGRLYARGQMYTQAIDEFRAVLDTEPERNDVRTALAEALWRDGQEDEAADWCRECLDHEAELHKPTLILGYLSLAGGQPEGEAMWQRAARQDPQLAMAHALFELLPPQRIDEPQLPAFDLQSWTQQQAAASAAATAPAGSIDDDFFDDSWLSGVSPATPPAQPPAAPPAPAATAPNDDDLLASLLAFDDPTPPVAQSNGAAAHTPTSGIYDTPPQVAEPEAADEWSDIKPFSFEDWNFDDVTPAPSQGVAADDGKPSSNVPLSVNDAAVQPFSFDELGSDIQPFSLDEPGGIQPFSFDDFNEPEPEHLDVPADQPVTTASHDLETITDDAPTGFSWQEPSWRSQQPVTSPVAPQQEDSIFDKPMQQAKSDAPAPAATPDEAEPGDSDFFSLDDADLRDASPAAAGAEPEMTPFSLADLGLSEEEIASFTEMQGTDQPAAPLPSVLSDEAELQPFSLADLGLTEEEIAEFGLPAANAATETPANTPDPALPPQDAPAPEHEPELTPFSLADLGLTDEEISQFDLGESPLPSAEQIAHAEVPTAEPVAQPPGPEIVRSASAAAAESSAPSVPRVNDAGTNDLARYQAQLTADPDNDTMRLAVARMSEQTGDLEPALDHYKQLLRRNVLVDPVADDLRELIAAHSEPALLRRLHRLLGDAYTKQDRFREAMEEYSWTPARGS
ncbi:MAG: tetratricopeptide repeat protein [Herpetosiphonaceae bacterium]|nr:tetratricopeptide repeat protein [Herpetosiphonaceae bacterium]